MAKANVCLDRTKMRQDQSQSKMLSRFHIRFWSLQVFTISGVLTNFTQMLGIFVVDKSVAHHEQLGLCD